MFYTDYNIVSDFSGFTTTTTTTVHRRPTVTVKGLDGSRFSFDRESDLEAFCRDNRIFLSNGWDEVFIAPIYGDYALKKVLEKNLISLPNEAMMDRIIRDAIKKFINEAFAEVERGNDTEWHVENIKQEKAS